MPDQPKPTHGEEWGPCAICGRTSLPKFGEFLCPRHATREHAKRAKGQEKPC